MTPTEVIVASTFPTISLTASVLGDRVVLRAKMQADADYVAHNCDALLPPLELIRAPMLVYLHCDETDTYREISLTLMQTVSDIQNPDDSLY